MKSVDTIDLKSLLGQRNSSYAEIVSVCKTMLGHFINKCIKKGGEDGRSLLYAGVISLNLRRLPLTSDSACERPTLSTWHA